MMQGSIEDISQAVGHTPIVRLNRITAGLSVEIYVKCEFLNPGGSHKDRLAANMLRRAESAGLAPGGTIVEATRGHRWHCSRQFAGIAAYS
jgi:cystathionine beta-synthase